MLKKYSIILMALLSGISMQAQDTTTMVTIAYDNAAATNVSDEVYQIKKGVDIPVTAVTTAYTLYGFSKIYNRVKPTEAEILALNPMNVNSFDRPITKNYDEKAKSASDKFFYGSMPMPLLLMLDKEIRKDAPKIGLLYLEAMGATGTLYVSSSMIASRYRPYAYNNSVDMATRTRGGAKNSFFAGHPALVATATFFTAKVFNDYHPTFKHKWALYTLAGGATLATGLLRIKAGQHFKSDVMVGIPVGIASGLLVPHWHKIRKGKMTNLSLVPTYQNRQAGFIATYKL